MERWLLHNIVTTTSKRTNLSVQNVASSNKSICLRNAGDRHVAESIHRRPRTLADDDTTDEWRSDNVNVIPFGLLRF